LQAWSLLPPEKIEFLKAEMTFFDEVTKVSGQLYPVAKDKRKSAAVELVGKASLVQYIHSSTLSPSLYEHSYIALVETTD
jgi:hypothetical protein